MTGADPAVLALSAVALALVALCAGLLSCRSGIAAKADHPDFGCYSALSAAVAGFQIGMAAKISSLAIDMLPPEPPLSERRACYPVG